jgi:signal transduction histidine kinase
LIIFTSQKYILEKNLYDYKDGKGKFVICELNSAAKKGGGTGKKVKRIMI